MSEDGRTSVLIIDSKNESTKKENSKNEGSSPHFFLQLFQKVYPNSSVSYLGSGGFGKVYQVGDMAVKVIPCYENETVEKVTKEAARELDHENLLKINRYIKRVDNHVLIESEYISGGTLFELRKKLPVKLHWMVLEQLSSALTYMHEKNLVHRDVKLSNVLVRESNTLFIKVVLGDFGLTRSMETISTQLGRSGTEAYLAPELYIDNPAYTPASDVFALGILMLYLISGTNLCLENMSFGKRILHEKDCRHDYTQYILEGLTHQTNTKIANLICAMLRKEPTDRVSCIKICSICKEVLLKNDMADFAMMGVASSLWAQTKSKASDTWVNIFKSFK